MDGHLVAIFCLSDALLRALGHREDVHSQMSDAEVMTTALVAALYFGGNLERAREHMRTCGYVPHMLSRSRFNRRWHRVAGLFWTLFHVLGAAWKTLNSGATYVIDSFPIAACDNYRIPRCHLCKGEKWRGYQASTKRYVYGLKLHLLVTAQGEPVEFFLSPGADDDTGALRAYNFDLPEGSTVLGDNADTDYAIEDIMTDAQVALCPLRKKNSTRPIPPWERYLRATARKTIETTGRLVEQLLPKHIHAVTARGFELKVALFAVACSFKFAFN
jgi:hypothetical protein